MKVLQSFIEGEFTQFQHANSCIAFDSEGRLYVVNLQLGILRIDVGSGDQETYAAPLPDLFPCTQTRPADPQNTEAASRNSFGVSP